MNEDLIKLFTDTITPIGASCVLGAFIFTALKFVFGFGVNGSLYVIFLYW